MNALLLVFALAAGVPGASADVQIIVNPSVAVSEVTAADINQIFLVTKSALGGTSVEPVFEESGAAHDLFLKTYIGKSDTALRNYFKTLVFTGRGSQPKAFASDAEVVKYVAATKGAIGYVAASADTAGTKRVQVK